MAEWPEIWWRLYGDGSSAYHTIQERKEGDFGLWQLNTHTKAAFYEAFPPAKARALVKRIDFRYTPKHGSWLNIAENELSTMTRQCASGRRFATIKQLNTETKAWSAKSNQKQRGVDWQFKIKDARTKLKSLYPRIKT